MLSIDLQEVVEDLNDISRLQSSIVSYISLPNSNEKPLSSILQASVLDLKPLLKTTSNKFFLKIKKHCQ